jgi:hypothetical protein
MGAAAFAVNMLVLVIPPTAAVFSVIFAYLYRRPFLYWFR